jgi:hypothetical protein
MRTVMVTQLLHNGEEVRFNGEHASVEEAKGWLLSFLKERPGVMEGVSEFRFRQTGEGWFGGGDQLCEGWRPNGTELNGL